MLGYLTTPNLPNVSDEVAHWTGVLQNAKKSGDTALAERARAALADAQARKAESLKAAKITDRRGLRKAAATL